MESDVSRPARKRRRLKGYDYSQPGAYFVTLCVQHRRELLGEVRDGRMRANDAGRMVERWWAELPAKFSHLELDAGQVMPNHVHGIILLWPEGEGTRPCAERQPRASLPEIVRWFKTMTTNGYIAGVREEGWPKFRGRLWQRDYHEHVVREGDDLADYRTYIRENPANWTMDEENPIALKIDPRWGGGIRPRSRL